MGNSNGSARSDQKLSSSRHGIIKSTGRCRDCSAEFTWVQAADGKWVPVDADDTVHTWSCPLKKLRSSDSNRAWCLKCRKLIALTDFGGDDQRDRLQQHGPLESRCPGSMTKDYGMVVNKNGTRPRRALRKSRGPRTPAAVRAARKAARAKAEDAYLSQWVATALKE